MTIDTMLQLNIFNETNNFVVSASQSNNPSIDNIKKLGSVLHTFNELGYSLSNADLLIGLPESDLMQLITDFTECVELNSKKGLVFRNSFLNNNGEIKAYTPEETMAIIAQYQLTYGNTISLECANTLHNYIAQYKNDTVDLTALYKTETKQIVLQTDKYLEDLALIYANSPKVLAPSQTQILSMMPTSAINNILSNNTIDFKINEIKILFVSLSSLSSSLLLLSNATDILKYIVFAYADRTANDPIEGQLLLNDLKEHRITIPTSARKQIVKRLNDIASKRGAKFLAEDMFKYTAYWKIIAMKLNWTKYKNTRFNFPYHTSAIDLLYENDRSWTFNGRYTQAIKDNDYATAIEVASEKPGFLLRNLINLIRYNTGQTIASTQTGVEDSVKTATSSAINFLRSDEFKETIQNTPSKLLFQLIEQLNAIVNTLSVSKRIVQGIVVDYTSPIPPIYYIHKILAHCVIEEILQSRKPNAKVYIDKQFYNYPLTYSGRAELSTSYTGKYLPKGLTASISSDLNVGSNNLIRLGVAWRSKAGAVRSSVDLDHNVTFMKGKHQVNHVSYKNSQLKHRNEIIAASSGDITECGSAENDSDFSIEFIDIDLDKAKKHGHTKFYNSIISFSGTSMDQLECYMTMQILDKHTHKFSSINSNVGSIDLNKTDYAVQLSEDTKCHVGISFDLTNDTFTVESLPIKSADSGFMSINENHDLINLYREANIEPLTIKQAFDLMGTTTTNKEEADILISEESINPLYNFNKIENLLFNKE